MTKQELRDRIKKLASGVVQTKVESDVAAVEWDELTKFPELKDVIVKLLTADFNSFMSSIDWVAPKPSTFRINLKNNQNFYLIYGTRSWIAQVEGKKYYLLNLPEEQHASEAISRILRYGAKEEASDENDGFGDFAPDAGAADAPSDTPEETPEPPTPE